MIVIIELVERRSISAQIVAFPTSWSVIARCVNAGQIFFEQPVKNAIEIAATKVVSSLKLLKFVSVDLQEESIPTLLESIWRLSFGIFIGAIRF